MRLKKRCLQGLVVVMSLLAAPTLAAAIKADETVVIFNTSAHRDGDSWVVPVHGWIFEREEDSWWRATLIRSLAEYLRPSMDAEGEAHFLRRTRLFLVDNERGKTVPLNIGGQAFASTPSKANGHFRAAARIPARDVDTRNDWLPIHVGEDTVRFRGRARLVAQEGLSVISDIDDTIKDSNVLDKQQLLANTFLRPFTPVAGMAGLYRRWEQSGAAFHYVSLSPWQLYPELKSFLDEADFPDGAFHLREFRAKDKSLLELFSAPDDAKLAVIDTVVRTYPRRTFVLVGDSGESDPEVYGAIARKYQGSVAHIYIRVVPASRLDEARFAAAFRGLANSTWTVFQDPKEIRE